MGELSAWSDAGLGALAIVATVYVAVEALRLLSQLLTRKDRDDDDDDQDS